MPVNAISQPPRVVLVRPNLKFNHRLHATRGIGCALCHGNAAAEVTVTRADLPMMASCLGCHGGNQGGNHDGKQATARCSACHLTQPDGRLQVNLATPATIAAGGTGLLEPSGSLRGFDAHSPTFRQDHAAGRPRRELLPLLPPPQRVRRLPRRRRQTARHPPLRLRHAARPRRAPQRPRLLLLPRLQTFCVGCHQRAGVASDPTGGLPGIKPTTPSGPARRSSSSTRRDGRATPRAFRSPPRGPSHSVQAKRNIRHLRLLPPRGELPGLPLRRPGAGPHQLLAPRPQLRAGPPAVGSWPPATSAPA